MAREDPHFRLRIPEDLKNRVEASAYENRRSITAEIIARVQRTFIEDEKAKKAERAANDARLLGEPSEETIMTGIRKIIAEELDKRS